MLDSEEKEIIDQIMAGIDPKTNEEVRKKTVLMLTFVLEKLRSARDLAGMDFATLRKMADNSIAWHNSGDKGKLDEMMEMGMPFIKKMMTASFDKNTQTFKPGPEGAIGLLDKMGMSNNEFSGLIVQALEAWRTESDEDIHGLMTKWVGFLEKLAPTLPTEEELKKNKKNAA